MPEVSTKIEFTERELDFLSHSRFDIVVVEVELLVDIELVLVELLVNVVLVVVLFLSVELVVVLNVVL